MEGTPKIYGAIANVMTDIGAVGKTSRNTQQGFMFRGIDAVMNAISPALIKNRVFIIPEVLEQNREERTTSKGTTLIYSICKVRYTFFAEDGSSVECIVIGEGMDSGDKATNKAMSIAFKYACFQTFCIPTEEMVDPDAECHEVKPRKGGTQKKPDQSAKQPGTPQQAAPAQSSQQVATITDGEVKALHVLLDNRGIDAGFVAQLYRVQDLKNMTSKMYDNAVKNIDNIEAMWKEKK
jgi:hypothetical protein